jgi:hypothetical protein
MTQVATSKLVAYGLTGKAASVQVSKLVGYVLMVPGEEGGGTPPARQGQVTGRIVRDVD